MINQIILVGRLTGDPEIEEYENGKKRTIINIAVQRQFKNIDNKYDTDFLDVYFGMEWLQTPRTIVNAET